jgi:hypothetical protein
MPTEDTGFTFGTPYGGAPSSNAAPNNSVTDSEFSFGKPAEQQAAEASKQQFVPNRPDAGPMEFSEVGKQAVENIPSSAIKFGEDFLWHINNPEQSDWYMNSEKPAIALSVFKSYYPFRQLEFATDLQYALNYEGRDLDDDEAYRHLLDKYSIVPEAFYAKLQDPEFKEQAYYSLWAWSGNIKGFAQILWNFLATHKVALERR